MRRTENPRVGGSIPPLAINSVPRAGAPNSAAERERIRVAATVARRPFPAAFPANGALLPRLDSDAAGTVPGRFEDRVSACSANAAS